MSTYFKNRKEIENFLNKLGIKNYTINSDLTVDVKGNVGVTNNSLKYIPVKFGRIEGDFEWINSELVSTYNFPHYAYNVDISGNKIIDYLNMDIDNEFICKDNPCVLFFMENERTYCETDYHSTDFRDITYNEDEFENNKQYLIDLCDCDDYEEWYGDMGYESMFEEKDETESQEYFEEEFGE